VETYQRTTLALLRIVCDGLDKACPCGDCRFVRRAQVGKFNSSTEVPRESPARREQILSVLT
jgi:hypothetical protein